MLKKSLFLIFILSFLVPSPTFSKNIERIRDSTIIYKIKADATPQQLKKFNALINKTNTITKREIKGVEINVIKLKNIKGLEKAFSKQLLDTGAVKFALPDASVPHDFIPNDSYYNSQWHHNVIDSPVAWDNTQGSASVKVCVLDTGVDTDHPDLVGNLLPGYNTAQYLSDGSTPNPYYHTDYVEAVLGHGTGTAGTTGAVGNNALGVAGVAWNIGIVPVKINYDDVGSYAYYSDMIDGIEWCADQGVKVANLSYGGAQNSAIAEAAQYLRERGGLLFMSAGNGGTYNNIIIYPDYTSFVAVGATDGSDILTYFSEYGPFVDIVAPGVDIATTYLDGDYIYYSGTSFSSPMAAGLASLLYSINPDFTPSEVENIIFNTAVDLGDAGDDEVYGNGRIDAGSAVLLALDYLEPNLSPVAVAAVDPLEGDAPLTVAFNGSGSTDDDGEVVSYFWDFGDGSTGSGETITYTYLNDGLYEAILTVTDNRATQATSDLIIIQVNPNPNYVNAPTDLNATVNGNNVLLSWNDNSSNETGFQIERAVKIRGKYNFQPLQTLIVDSISYTDEAVEAGSYKYRVYAYKDDNAISDYSNEAAVKVESTLPPDSDPSGLSAPALSASVAEYDVTLNWTDECPQGDVCTYHVDRGDAKIRGQIIFSFFTDINETTLNTTENDPSTYYYRVFITTESGGKSDYSNIATIRIK
jgi:subtilisin family serine protease